MKKLNLKGMTQTQLEEVALSVGEKKFRGQQLYTWLYAKEASSFEAMTSLSKTFREQLEATASIEALSLIESKLSSDGTTKFLFELSDKKRIESVLIPPRMSYRKGGEDTEDELTRRTLCISTQVGCPLDCAFCATASMGFLRNLTAGEIVDQVIQVKKHSGMRITNIVYMGMGEPLLNYEHVMNSADIIINGLNIAARHITVSTAGWIPGIRQMADEQKKIKLAVSLHSLDEGVRTKIMPLNAKYPLAEVLKSVEYYYAKIKKRVTFEYILFEGVNDTEKDITRITALTKRMPCKFNIIPFHSITPLHSAQQGLSLQPTPKKKIEEFVERLREKNVTVFVRSSAGEDIDAACGQLAVRHERRSRKADAISPTT